jgi:hypothetical protein
LKELRVLKENGKMSARPGRINVKTIIANVIRDAQLKNVNSLIDSMIEWAYEAETFIGSYDTFVKKECEIEFRNYRARIPKDLYQFIALKVNGQFPEVTNRDFRLFYKDSPHLARPGVTQSNHLDLARVDQAYFAETTSQTGMKFAIENQHIHLSGGEMPLKAGLAYLAFDLDEEGYPYIKDGHEKAVVAYILWKMKTADWLNGKLNQGVYDRLENRWYMLCGQARGDDEMPDSKELEYIANMYHQLLPMPNKNFF